MKKFYLEPNFKIFKNVNIKVVLKLTKIPEIDDFRDYLWRFTIRFGSKMW